MRDEVPNPEIIRTPKPRMSKSLDICGMKQLEPIAFDYGEPLKKPLKRSMSDSLASEPRKINNFGHSKQNRLIMKANRMILDRSRIKPRHTLSNNP